MSGVIKRGYAYLIWLIYLELATAFRGPRRDHDSFRRACTYRANEEARAVTIDPSSQKKKEERLQKRELKRRKDAGAEQKYLSENILIDKQDKKLVNSPLFKDCLATRRAEWDADAAFFPVEEFTISPSKR